jgi:hypothetical protein
MEKLEQLKKEMLDAKEAYDTFKTNNSRVLTEEESNELQFPIFGMGVEQSETRMFELIKENFDEMRRLGQNMKDTHSVYVKKYMNNTKQKERLGFIKVANDLNQEMCEKHGETEDKFYYSTDGHIDIFGFGDKMLWNSEMDDRIFIEEKNDYEDFKPFIIQVFNNWIESLNELSL